LAVISTQRFYDFRCQTEYKMPFMKIISTICFVVVITFFSSCKRDRQETVPAFTYEQAAGIWVPYELAIDGKPLDGRTLDGTRQFTGNSIFGTLAESVQLKNDKTFIPVTWITKDNFTLNTAETGTFEYLSSNKLSFKGLRVSEWDIIKFEGDDLWLRQYVQKFYVGSELSEQVYKFKRQH
jgi:hypothetical protein